MSHKLILMLGIGKGSREKQEQPFYKKAKYFRYSGMEKSPQNYQETSFVGEAILELFPEKGFDEVHILGTEASMWDGLVEHFLKSDSAFDDLPSFIDQNKSHSFNEQDLAELDNFLNKHGDGGKKVACRLIPFGKSKEELWEIFNTIAGIGHKGDRISIDITHSFRHLPFFSFLALVYMRQIKQIEFGSVFYGALEMRSNFNDKAPIFDLASFLEILDWIMAVERFQNSFAMNSFDFLGEENENRSIPKKEAAKFVESIQKVGKNFQINNIAQMIPDLENLRSETQKLENKIGGQQGPFGLIAPEIKKTTERIVNGKDTWGKYLNMADAFCKKGHLGNAVLAIEEAVIEYICGILACNPKEKENSKFAVGLACQNIDMTKPPKGIKRDSLPKDLNEQVKGFFESHPDLANWDRHFSELRNYRNQIAHGFRSDALQVDKLTTDFIQEKISFFQRILQSNTLHGLREIVLGEPK